MPPPDFTKPDPNDAATRRVRNQRLAQYLDPNSDDVTEVYLETLSTGGTRWRIVFRDGTTDTCS